MSQEHHHEYGRMGVYQPKKCEVLSVSDLTSTEKLFRLKLSDGSELDHRPGQFVQLSVYSRYEAPISVCCSPGRKGYFELAIRNSGELTREMHATHVGDSVGIRGPMGSYFNTFLLEDNDLVLVAGGCGLAPMRSLIQYCEDNRDKFGRISLLCGFRSPRKILFESDLEAWRDKKIMDVSMAFDGVEPGESCGGHVGRVTELIPGLNIDPARTVVVIVGPPVMYRPVIEAFKPWNLKDHQILLSLERHMRCGFGKCGHCRIGHLYCCVDGPVFWLNEVRNIEGAF